MRLIIYIICCFCFISCSSLKHEKEIANLFLYDQLSTKQYENYKNFDILLFNNAGSNVNTLGVYEYSFKNRDGCSCRKVNPNDDGSYNIKNWILDSLEIAQIKSADKNNKTYFWKKSDFKNFNIAIITSEENSRNIKSELYLKKKYLLISISKPFLIDENNALIYFNSTLADGLNSSIEHFGVLLKKVNGKWMRDAFLDDGIYY